jgi:hypothetical protein
MATNGASAIVGIAKSSGVKDAGSRDRGHPSMAKDYVDTYHKLSRKRPTKDEEQRSWPRQLNLTKESHDLAATAAYDGLSNGDASARAERP